MYIISACLLGDNCKYSGGNNRREEICEFAKTHSFVRVCPEQAGGLPTPRPPAEFRGERIINKEGKDVTANFERGAELSLAKAFNSAEEAGEKIEGAILKAKSPSCGKDRIYDGTFTGTLRDGDGCFVRALKEKGITVISEEDFNHDKF